MKKEVKKFEGEWERVYGKVWMEEKEGRNGIIKL